MWDLNSPTRDRTHIGRWIIYRWTTREVPVPTLHHTQHALKRSGINREQRFSLDDERGITDKEYKKNKYHFSSPYTCMWLHFYNEHVFIQGKKIKVLQ